MLLAAAASSEFITRFWMEMGTQKWRIQLVEDDEALLPVLWQPPPEPERDARAAEAEPLGPPAILDAFRRLGRRGEGAAAWTAPLAGDPVAFLLDAIGDAVNLWGPSGQLLYRNRQAEELNLDWPSGTHVERLIIGARTFERRCLTFAPGQGRFDTRDAYLLDVVHELRCP